MARVAETAARLAHHEGMTHRVFGFLVALVFAGVSAPSCGAVELVRRTWMIDGVTREALISEPGKAVRVVERRPVILVFHGHGGTMRQAARSMPLHEFWSDAVVVFPQGLPTPGRLTDPSGTRTGWQREVGDQGDRDLRLVDAILATLRESGCLDEQRIFATGHSNGGAFTYLLWAERADVFAAFAPSAAVLVRGAGKFVPRPVLHIGSPQDPLVKFAWQSRMIDHVLAVNECGPRLPDAPGYVDYEPHSSRGAPVAVFLHEGGHGYPAAAPEHIVRFFQTSVCP